MTGLAARVGGVIFVAYNFPEILLHRLAAARLVALFAEGDLVGRDLGEVFATSGYRLSYCGEALACVEFVARRQG